MFNQMSTCCAVSPCRKGRHDMSEGRLCGRRRRSCTKMRRAQNSYTYRVFCSRYTSHRASRDQIRRAAQSILTLYILISPCYLHLFPSLRCSQIVDVQFLSAMNPTAGSFEICERLQRHFATFACQMPSASDLKLVYSSILSGHMLGWGDSINTMCARVVDASILIHSMVS